jgi:putative DNA methylase
VIFCQMVDDPSAVPEEFPTDVDQENERLRLFALISELVLWESTTNEAVLNQGSLEVTQLPVPEVVLASRARPVTP